MGEVWLLNCRIAFCIACAERGQDRRALRQALWSSLEYICVALFLIAAYDVLLFFRGISTGDLESDTWVARGFVNVLVVPVLGVAGWRFTIDRVVDIRRPVAFYVSWLLVLGISMAVWLFADLYVIAIGPYWGNVATIVGVAATLLAVSIVLLSGTIRGRSFEQWPRSSTARAALSGSRMKTMKTISLLMPGTGSMVQEPGGFLARCANVPGQAVAWHDCSAETGSNAIFEF